MAHGAEDQQHSSSNSQWGARPGCSTKQPDLCETASCEISQLTQTPLGRLDTDATACCDRIVMSLALMICQKHGVPQSACMVVAMALMITANCSIKTGCGISKGTCSSTGSQPTCNPGQGSRLALALWMIVICVCFSAMFNLCHGVSFCDLQNQLVHRPMSDGFVDDATHWSDLGSLHGLLNDALVQDIASGLKREGQSAPAHVRVIACQTTRMRAGCCGQLDAASYHLIANRMLTMTMAQTRTLYAPDVTCAWHHLLARHLTPCILLPLPDCCAKPPASSADC